MTVVTFGLTSSAHLSVRCLIQAAREAAEEHPEAAKVIEKDFYMDDCVSGESSTEKAITLALTMEFFLAGAGFKLTKWKSNDQQVLQALGVEPSDTENGLVFSGDGETSVLGVKWIMDKDLYTYVVKTPNIKGVVTKRKIVSCVAQLFDPDGYISPVVVVGKLIIQELWKAKLDWDDPVDEPMEKTWNELWNEIGELEKLKIPRWIGTADDTKTRLIGFSDSSKRAFGAVIYARTEYPNGSVKSQLLTSKTRVAPLKELSIPRLELAGAELLARLLLDVSER